MGRRFRMGEHVEKLQAGQVFLSAMDVVDIGEESGEDPRAIIEQLLLVATTYARANDLPMDVICRLPELYLLTLVDMVPAPGHIIGDA